MVTLITVIIIVPLHGGRGHEACAIERDLKDLHRLKCVFISMNNQLEWNAQGVRSANLLNTIFLCKALFNT